MTFAVLPVGAPARKKLDAVRRSLARVTEELASLEDAPLPPEIAADRTVVAALPVIEQARRDLLGTFRYRVQASLENEEGLRMVRDALTDPSELRARLVAYFNSDGMGPGISDQERADKVAALSAQRSELLESEEALTRDLEGAGLLVDRNPEADPELLLRVWGARV